ncbi:MAG: hypothetical protein IKG21_06580 [Atopobiaceae bacterium]|nr:hypothetical protein [Atopobiaceae bacterium]
MKYDIALMYTCSLIEFIGRKALLRRGDVVRLLGDDTVARIYRHADVLHSESIERVADEYMSMSGIKKGNFNNVATCRYEVPDYWTMGEVFERLIEDVDKGDVLATLREVYGSWMCDALSNYNSDLFYQPRDYLRECYLAGEILAA